MATLSSNVYSNVGTTPVEIIYADGTKNITVLGLNICNKSQAPVTVDGYYDRSGNLFYIFKTLSIDPETTIVAIGDNQRLILNPYTQLKIVASANSSIDVIASIAETYI